MTMQVHQLPPLASRPKAGFAGECQDGQMAWTHGVMKIATTLQATAPEHIAHACPEIINTFKVHAHVGKALH